LIEFLEEMVPEVLVAMGSLDVVVDLVEVDLGRGGHLAEFHF
jgi:hypothetical protein